GREKFYDLGFLKKDTYFSATLAWDRIVHLLDKDGKLKTEEVYQRGDKFKADRLANLDLFLIKKGEWGQNPGRRYASKSLVDSVEHIFFKLEEDADYQLVVFQRSDATTNYGLAWWGVPGKKPG